MDDPGAALDGGVLEGPQARFTGGFGGGAVTERRRYPFRRLRGRQLTLTVHSVCPTGCRSRVGIGTRHEYIGTPLGVPLFSSILFS